LTEDEEIIDYFRIPEKRNEPFNLLIGKYQKRIYWHIRKMVIDHEDANDLTQEVFIKVWKNLDQFRQEAGLYTWIYKIATNECLNFLAKQKRKYFLPILNAEKILLGKLQSSAYISGDEIQLALQKALLKLPDKQRIVFNMKYFDDLKYEEISAILGTSVGALKASYHLAVKKIENYMNNHGLNHS
jgi:RNA polymerase sigma factor (sigma-70 family)